MVDVSEVAKNIYLIDDQLFSIPKFGSVYLINEEKKALIDTGPATSVNVVLDGIEKAGVNPADIDYLVVTHIHLDHSGGVGGLLESMPKVRILVHSRGAKHLIDPKGLVSSVLEVEGKEAFAKYGQVLPVAMQRIQAMHDGDTVSLGERQVLKFMDAAGHATHALCIHESRNNGVFVGDALGILIFAGEVLLPFHPPPSFNLELAFNTIDRIRELNASILYFTHFGMTEKVAQTLQLTREKLEDLDIMLVRVIGSTGYESAAEQMISYICSELELVGTTDSLLYEYVTKNLIPLWATGHINYYKKSLLGRRRKSEGNKRENRE
jgi:glyoxylase-like metal-dependent hydrolase (beta-lactamase superfamily II)